MPETAARPTGRPSVRVTLAGTDRCDPHGASFQTASVLAYSRRAHRSRVILAVRRPDATVLVLDCANTALGDARVIAHLDAQEPRENALLLARMYLGDPRRGEPRRLERDDLELRSRTSTTSVEATEPATLSDARGHRFEIAPVREDSEAPELRWTRRTPGNGAQPEAVSLRETLGALEVYEPACSLTLAAVQHAAPPVRAARLRSELDRLQASPIVLNRGLREAVQHAVAQGTSLSAIALRCGRLKSDSRGRRSGETSWLARRIGQMPEGGKSAPTPWIHSDTLALIAREGLAVSPREVEL